MNAQAVTLHLPVPLYDLLQQRAQETRRSLEAEILDVVTSAVSPDDDLAFGKGKIIPTQAANITQSRRVASVRSYRLD